MCRSICFIALLIALTGCTPWPAPSSGGYAYEYIFMPSYQGFLFKNHFPYSLSQRLYYLSEQTLYLSYSHAQKCYPARFTLLHALEEQIAQEIGSGLYVAAESDLVLYENNVILIRKLNNNKGCPRPKKDPSWECLKSREQ